MVVGGLEARCPAGSAGLGLLSAARDGVRAWSAGQSCGAAEVESHGGHEDLTCDFGEPDVSGAGQAHAPLPGREGGLYGGAAAGDQVVQALLPWREGVILA